MYFWLLHTNACSMTRDTAQLMAWLKEGEHYTLDFKQTVNDPVKIARTISAFANTHGGIILIGLDDFGDVRGIDPEQEKFIMQKAANEYCDPAVALQFRELETDEGTCLAVYVERHPDGMVAALDSEGVGRIFIRDRDECLANDALAGERARLEADSEPVPIYTADNSGLINYLKQHQHISIRQYQKLMSLSFLNAKQSLERLRHAGVLKRHKGKDAPWYTLED